MRRSRDNQRSRVYAWERACTNDHKDGIRYKTLEEVEQWMNPIWRAERGRVGLAKKAAPTLSRKLWGVRGGTASTAAHEIKLSKWARSPWVILHEMTHLLTPRDEAHGPRFVGVLIGLLARHCGQDANELMALADEMSVKYHVRAIGTVPVTTLPERLAKLLPVHYMEAAVELDVPYRSIYGAALPLIRHGRARWRGKTLVPL